MSASQNLAMDSFIGYFSDLGKPSDRSDWLYHRIGCCHRLLIYCSHCPYSRSGGINRLLFRSFALSDSPRSFKRPLYFLDQPDGTWRHINYHSSRYAVHTERISGYRTRYQPFCQLVRTTVHQKAPSDSCSRGKGHII